MPQRFRYTISGTGRNETNWSTEGTVTVENQGQFTEALRLAQHQSFQRLTEGTADYGQPGPCGGPYRIEKFLLVLEP